MSDKKCDLTVRGWLQFLVLHLIFQFLSDWEQPGYYYQVEYDRFYCISYLEIFFSLKPKTQLRNPAPTSFIVFFIRSYPFEKCLHQQIYRGHGSRMYLFSDCVLVLSCQDPWWTSMKDFFTKMVSLSRKKKTGFNDHIFFKWLIF